MCNILKIAFSYVQNDTVLHLTVLGPFLLSNPVLFLVSSLYFRFFVPCSRLS